MVSGNVPVWMILLVPLAFWAFESLQMASPGTSKPTNEHVQLQIFQTTLLMRMGLQRRPDPKPKLPVPQYLLDLYRLSSSQFPASPKDAGQPFLEGRAATANTVRIFYHVEDSAQVCEGAGNLFYFLFNLTMLPLEEELVALELRLYHSPKDSQGLYIHVYHAVDPPPVAPNKSRLLTCKFVTPSHPKWLSFDVTAAFQEARERKRHLGLLVEVQPSNRSQDLPCQQTSLHARCSPGQEEAQWTRERPFLVTYSIDQRGQPLTHRKRQSRSRPVRGKGASKVQASARKHKGLRPYMEMSTNCERQPMVVDFKAMGWGDWIIAPPMYNAFYCVEECSFPLGNVNSTNHAILQSTLNSLNPRVPKAGCVPIKLSSINMLYINKFDMVVFKKFPDMVVEECGCR